ncbi:MAG: tyrosine-type recombinase/integrase, partial [Planctomycetota bacterium]
MASIYKRGNVWWIHYHVAGRSVCRSLRTTSQRVAEDRKKRMEALEVTDQLHQPSSTPIEPFLQTFCEYLLATQTRKGAKNDLSCLRQFFGPACKALEFGSRVPHKFRDGARELPTVPDKLAKLHVPVKRLEQISAEMINSFIQERITIDGIAPKTANRLRGVLHRMFNFAIEQFGFVCRDPRYHNPVRGVRRIKENAPTITWLRTEEIDQQLELLKDHPQLRAMVATYIFAGLRREAGLWLTQEDVDLTRRVLHVRAKEVDGAFWQPKTKRNRSVPISSDLFQILCEYTPAGDLPWFFPGPTGNRWHPDHFSSKLRQINAAAGLSWSCLDYRHTFGSHLAQKGESLYKIAELMGNSPGICQKHYAALMPHEMREEVEFGRERSAA